MTGVGARDTTPTCMANPMYMKSRIHHRKPLRLIQHCLWLHLAIPLPAIATIEVNVTRVGFPTTADDVFRGGAWTPIIVDLALNNETSFDGSLRVGQRDRDGDECYDRVNVHLRAETGGNQRYYLYVLADRWDNKAQFVVELFDEEGNAVLVPSQQALTYQVEPAQQPIRITDDDVVVLSISNAAIGRVQELTQPRQGMVASRQLHVGHMSPFDLPELWIGLEMVDYIVWDDARPEELTQRQVAALVEWVQQGGTLLLAASRSAGAIRLSEPLYSILPAELGPVKPVVNLPDIRRALLSSTEDSDDRLSEDNGWWELPFASAVATVDCTLRVGAVRVARDPQDPNGQSNILTRRDVGRGQVLFSGVTLRDLFSGGGDAVRFFHELFDLGPNNNTERVIPETEDLSPFVESAVSFAKSGSVFLGLAIIFSAGYVLLATLGSWTALGVRGWRHHSWTAFGLVGIAASLLSVVAVNGIRGLGVTMHQISIVDLSAGEAKGFATALFGIKTGTDRRMNFWLPADPIGATDPTSTNCFLRPLPAPRRFSGGLRGYSDPGAYALVPAAAVINDVRIRATLKQLEGRWTGALGGTVTGALTTKGIELLDGSYVINNLGVDLKDCYLLHTAMDLKSENGFRSRDIYAYPLGDLPANGAKVDLLDRCYPIGVNESIAAHIKASSLADAQQRWGAELTGFLRGFRYSVEQGREVKLGQEKNALLLATTVGEYDPANDAGMAQALLGARTWSRSRLRQLDLRKHLRRDTAVLIGFADDPGPVRLFRSSKGSTFSPLEPEPAHSWTMYRIRLPVTVLDTPGELEDKDDPAR